MLFRSEQQAQNERLARLERVGMQALTLLIGEAVDGFPAQFHARIVSDIEAAQCVSRAVTIRVSPDDAQADALLEKLQAHGWTVQLVRDAHVDAGVIVDHATGRFVATPAAFLRAAEDLP